MKVEFVPGNKIGGGVARVSHLTGQLFINKDRWQSIPPIVRKFIVLHEAGHYYGQTESEFYADAFAFAGLGGTEPGSLVASISALTDYLGESNYHLLRTLKVLKNVCIFDYLHNNNERALEELPFIVSSEKELHKKVSSLGLPRYESGEESYIPAIGTYFHRELDYSKMPDEKAKQLRIALGIEAGKVNSVIASNVNGMTVLKEGDFSILMEKNQLAISEALEAALTGVSEKAESISKLTMSEALDYLKSLVVVPDEPEIFTPRKNKSVVVSPIAIFGGLVLLLLFLNLIKRR